MWFCSLLSMQAELDRYHEAAKASASSNEATVTRLSEAEAALRKVSSW